MYRSAKLFGILLSALFAISAQNLNGSNTIQLSGPANNEQINMAKNGARTVLKADIIRWLKNAHEFKIDTSNSLTNFSLEVLTDSCINRCKIEPSYKGKELTIFLSLSDSAADEALDAFNKAIEDSALQAWSKVTDSQTQSNFSTLLSASVRAYSYATILFGEPLKTPNSPQGILAEDALKIVQSLFNRIKIQSSNMIIQGKIGRSAEQPPVVTVSIDTIPLSNFWLSGSLQNGKPNFSASSNEQGQVSLKELVIPLVQNGALFYLTPDIGKFLGLPTCITPKEIQIQLKDGQIQTFMFKVTRPTYTLDYKLTSDASLKIPAEFNNSATIKKYLRDSCYFAEAQAGIPPDFIINVESVISNSASDITEEVGLKMNATITIKGLSLETPKTETKKVELDRKYGKQVSLPYGMFLWDFNTALKQNIRSTLNKL